MTDNQVKSALESLLELIIAIRNGDDDDELDKLETYCRVDIRNIHDYAD